MKKLLLSLFAVATVFVACDKEAIDVQEPTAIEIEEANASVGISVDAEGFINSLAGSVTKGEIEASSARVGAAGTQWIHVVFFTFGSSNIPLAYLRSDDTAEVCPENGQVSVLYTLETAPSGASRLAIDQIQSDGTVIPTAYSNIGVSLRANYATLFGQTINRLSRARADFSGVADGNVPSLTLLASNGIDFDCAPAINDEWVTSDTSYPKTSTNEAYPGSSFTVDRAPFPLTGFLTRIAEDAFDGTSLYYAASTEEAAMNEIIENIEDGN